MSGSCARPLAISTSWRSAIDSRRTGASGAIGLALRDSKQIASAKVEHALGDGADRGQILDAEPDVLGDGQVGNERQLLKDGRDFSRPRLTRIARAIRLPRESSFRPNRV